VEVILCECSLCAGGLQDLPDLRRWAIKAGGAVSHVLGTASVGPRRDEHATDMVAARVLPSAPRQPPANAPRRYSDRRMQCIFHNGTTNSLRSEKSKAGAEAFADGDESLDCMLRLLLIHHLYAMYPHDYNRA
jgi:hypothetical protein